MQPSKESSVGGHRTTTANAETSSPFDEPISFRNEEDGQVDLIGAHGSSLRLCCDRCPTLQLTAYAWCKTFECSSCGCVKYWCSACNTRQVYDDFKAAERHGRRKHLDVTVQPTIQGATCEADGQYDRDAFIGVRKPIGVSSDKFVQPSGAESRKYFENNQYGNGTNFLVNLMSHGLPIPSPRLNQDEIRYHLLLSRLCLGLSRGQREILAEILQLTHKFLTDPVTTEDEDNLESSWHIPPKIPTSANDLRSMYMEGKNAIATNVPRPVVSSLGGEDHHSYVSLIDIVSDVIAKCDNLTQMLRLKSLLDRKKPNIEQKVRSIMETARFEKIMDRASSRCKTDNPIVLWATVWSDDHEPNNLLQNRGSVHLMTITIAADPSNDDPILSDAQSRTYPVSVSAKGANHEELERVFANELKQLCRENEETGHVFIWNPRIKAYEEVYLEIFVSLQDQPERRSANHLLGGNSQFHSRWMWSCDVGHIAKHLPACNNCLSRLLTNGNPSLHCLKCVSFDFTRTATAMLEFPPPKGYPVEILTNPSSMLKPFRLSYSQLQASVKFARDKVEDGLWTLATAAAFLKSFCLNESIIEQLLMMASYRQEIANSDEMTGRPGSAQDRAKILREISKRHPELLHDSPCPGAWVSPVTLDQRIDVIMHLLFLGVTKSTAFMIRDWTKMKERGAAFNKHVKDTLQVFPNITWCTTAAYTGEKLGGWISENYMALARLSKWFYGQLRVVITDYYYTPPSQPVDKWRVNECHQWFRSHGIKLANVLADDIALPEDVALYAQSLADDGKPLTRATVLNMRQIIACYLRSSNGPPVLLSHRVPSVEQIIKLICSLHTMIAAVMSPATSTEHAAETEKHIKIFLSIYSRIEESIRLAEDPSSKRKPDWVTQYNFMSLLNLPNIMREYGPLRNLWEGGDLGEKFIRRSKEALSNGLRGNWEVVTATKILTDQSIRNLCTSFDVKPNSPEQGRVATFNFIREQGKIYKSVREILDTLQKRHPISVIVPFQKDDAKCSCVYLACYDSADYSEVVFINFSTTQFHCSDGCHHYFYWSVSDERVRSADFPFATENRANGAIMLPLITTDSDELNAQNTTNTDKTELFSYTLLQSDWKEIDPTGCIRAPQLQFTSFP